MANDEKKIYFYLEKKLSESDKKAFEEKMSRSDVFSYDVEETKRLQFFLSNLENFKFRPRFAERVVLQLKSLQIKNEVEDFFAAFVYMFRRFVLVGAAAVVIIFSINAIHSDTNFARSVSDYVLSELTLDEAMDPTLSSPLEELL